MSRNTGSKAPLLLSCIALTACLALAVDWLAVEWLGIGSPAARWGLLAVSLACALAAMMLSAARRKTLFREALEQLDSLSRSDPSRLAALARRVDELERERSVLKVHARRDAAQTQRVQSILSALAEPVLVIDKRDELVLANSSAGALFSIDADNGQRCPIDTLVECERLVDLLIDTRKCRAFTQRNCEIEIGGREGASQWFRVTARNIPTQPGQSDPDGTSQGVVAVLHDISGQKTIQKRNAEFVSALSHEMKTPLAGIKAYLELLADGDAEDEQTEEQFLQVIATEADRLQCLVDDLVELARIEADLAGASRQDQPLSGLLADALAAVRPQADAKRLTVSAEFCHSDLRVFADRQMITQAAAHLLSNAVKYTPRDGRLTLRCSPAGNEVCFEVEDTGVGLSAEDCRRVFEKFYRVPKTEGTGGGTGLGLPLVKHIVEAVHGGRIEVSSVVGQGSVFRVFLPAAAEACPARSDSPASAGPQEVTND